MGDASKVESATKIKIVIVEKHSAVRCALHNRLRASPHLEVVAAVSEPAAALPYLGSIDAPGEYLPAPEVVLLGLHNGSDDELFETLTIIQQIVRRPTAVIVLAPYADEVERLLMQQAGASRYLLKYIDSQQLIHEIEAAAHRGLDLVANW
jgi:DNA-binding NarL/FixJ family response regulator